jgi:two-component system phosphate regulon sensor histidine kinase PhoR
MSQLGWAISQRQAINQILEQHIETWKQIVTAAPVGYLQVDEENQFIWCNPVAAQMLGLSQSSQHPPRLLLELVRSYEIDSLVEKARDRAQPCQREWVFYPASANADNLSQAKSIPLRGTAFPLAQGEVGVFLENRQEAMTLIQQRDRWTSDVAHELKTPLTSIRLVAETLQSRLDPTHRAWMTRLLNETIRLSTLVQDLLDLSQLDLNPSQRLRRKSVDLVKIIYAAWQTLEPLTSEKHLRFSFDGCESVILNADEARMHRVFLNLLDNSIKYSPRNGVIRVQVRVQPPDRITIDLIDEGAGFPEEALPHVFDRFYRADPSRVRSLSSMTASDAATAVQLTSGSGLGLAIVRQIIEAHQGRVQAHNRPEGGAWLQIGLPYQEPR